MTHPKLETQLSDEHLAAIGRVTVAWTELEKALESIVWLLAPLEQPNAQAVTTHITARAQLDIVRSLARLATRDTALVEKLDNHIKFISKKLSVKRNEAVHSKWFAGKENKPSVLTTRARGTLAISARHMATKEVDLIAIDIHAASVKLLAIAEEIIEATPSKGRRVPSRRR